MSASPPGPAGVLRFSGFRRAVSDLERSVDFHVRALGFGVDRAGQVPGSDSDAVGSRAAPTRFVHLSLGRESIELFAPVGCERHLGADVSPDGAADLAFHHIAIVTGDMDAALHRLERYSPAPISSAGPVLLPQGAGGVTAFKFRDPDGHPLELILFPPGAGDARWQTRAARPTLGIDHSAIAVSNVARSLAFYADALGMRLQSRQTNRGVAQARLDGTEASEVDVVALAPRDATPHLELLGYRVPPPRRIHSLPALADDHADRMTFAVDDLTALIARLDRLPADLGTERRSIDPHTLLLRDPDGHLLLLRQEAPPSSTSVS